MKITISNKIYIKDAPTSMIKLMKKALTLPNPVYMTLLRRVKYGAQSHRCLYAVKKNFTYYDHNLATNVFSCGRGLYSRIQQYCIQHSLTPDVKIGLVSIALKKPLQATNLTLRDYQVGVTDEILEKGECGVIKLSTGYGKTLIACEIIRKLNKTALIIVPRNSILAQFKETLKEFYDYEVGIIQGKTWDIKDITIASMATLKQRKIVDTHVGFFSICIVDEAHTCISDKGIAMVQQINPKFLYGLTATPRRTDEQGEAIFFTFGPILCDRELPQKKPRVQIIKSDVPIGVSVDYHEMIQVQTENEERNVLIFKLAGAEILNGRKVLILTKRIEHYRKIGELFPHKIIKYEINSSDKQADRDILLTQLRNNEIRFDIILGTYSMLSTGVDIPSLETIIFAGDLKSDVLSEQSAGRILRLMQGKKDPKIIDIDDNLNPILHKQALCRRSFYKKMKWKIL